MTFHKTSTTVPLSARLSLKGECTCLASQATALLFLLKSPFNPQPHVTPLKYRIIVRFRSHAKRLSLKTASAIMFNSYL